MSNELSPSLASSKANTSIARWYAVQVASSCEKKVKATLEQRSVTLGVNNNKNINGSIIISKEGLNGSISGMNKDIKTTIIRLKKILNIKEFDSVNNSISKFKPFHKPKVKIKREVVPMDLKMSNRITKKNTHIDPTKWNKLIKKKKLFY